MAYRIATIVQSGDNNAKTKHHGTEIKPYTISLASSDASGRNVCARAMPRRRIDKFLAAGRSEEWIHAYARKRRLSMCSKSCVVYLGGHGRRDSVQDARINLTSWYYENRRSFKAYLLRELARIDRNRGDSIIAVRPDCDSDIQWEDTIPEMFDFDFEWYDYSKISTRLGCVPPNYHLTYSVNDATDKEDMRLVYEANANIAVVFDTDWQNQGKPQHHRFGYLPATFTDLCGRVWPVIDGDANEFRFLDPVGVCVGMRLKAGLAERANARKSEFAFPVSVPGFDRIHPADAPPGHYVAAA